MVEQTDGKKNFVESFADYVFQALDILQLKTEQIEKTAKDEEAFTMGLVMIALAGVATAVGRLEISGLIFYPVLVVVFAFIWAGILHLLATLVFKGEGDFMEFFRPFSHTCILYWVAVIPILGWAILAPLAEIWGLVVTVVIVEKLYGLDRPKAIATVLIPVAAFLLLFLIFGSLIMMWWLMMSAAMTQ